MLQTPPGFESAIEFAFDEDAIAHVFVGDALVQFSDSPGALPWRFYREAGLSASRVHALGRHEGRPHVAVAVDVPGASDLPAGLRAAGLRNWFGVVDDETMSIAMRAVQVLEWDRTHRYCGACGAPTERVERERARRCPGCGLVAYPRISPAMMVLVSRGDELLLARGLNFPPGRYAALAGFLEAGESVEDAVHREVLEEVGIGVRNLRYYGSQSWPFPNSLMIAFHADWAAGDVRASPDELADARWFRPDALPQLPPPFSISRALIESRLDELRGN